MFLAQLVCTIELNIDIVSRPAQAELDDRDFRHLQGIQITTLSIVADRSTAAPLLSKVYLAYPLWLDGGSQLNGVTKSSNECPGYARKAFSILKSATTSSKLSPCYLLCIR